MDYRAHFIVDPAKRPDLSGIDPDFHDAPSDRAAGEALAATNLDRIAAAQTRLFAEGGRAVLICLQGMDASGKDGVVTSIMHRVNPMGCAVQSFKTPTEREKAHDFLWRIHAAAPAKGRIGIFNRSHYEAVLIEKVHKLAPPDVIGRRYRQIAEFERLLGETGTTVIKFFLHISVQEQLSRFKDRLDDPLKRWKISEADYAERRHWDEYMRAYEDALANCSTAEAPWYVIPSNHKWFRDLAISQITAATLDDMKIPVAEPGLDLALIRRKYHEAAEQ